MLTMSSVRQMVFTTILAGVLQADRAAPQPARSAPTTRQASLRGVVTDTAGRAIANAVLSIDALKLTTRSSDNGEYRLTSIPQGTHLVTARGVGFEPATLTIDFPSDAERVANFSLRLARTVLDSVEVKATRIDPRMQEFEEHRRFGIGHFITSEELRRQEGQRLSSIVGLIPGLGLVNGRANQAWIFNKRLGGGGSCRPWDGDGSFGSSRRPPAGGSRYTPSRAEMSQGIACACYAQVYVDGQLMNPGMPSDPFDVNSIPTHQVEAIEFYTGGGQTPAKYSRLNSACGVYVMHTRRPPGG